MALNAGLAAYIASHKKKSGNKSTLQKAAAARVVDSAKVNKDNLVPTGKQPVHLPPWLANTPSASSAKAPAHVRGGGPASNTPPWLNKNSKGN